MKRKSCFAYVDGMGCIGDVLEMALDRNIMLTEMKGILVKNYGERVTFKVEYVK